VSATRVKFCGMTGAEDVALAAAAGADAVGVILAESPRRVETEALPSLVRDAPPFLTRVAVVAGAADETLETLRDLGFVLQFTGDETPEACARGSAGEPYLRVVHLAPDGRLPAGEIDAFPGATLLLDTKVEGRLGGTGRSFDWSEAAALARRRRVVIAGGLRPETVGACVRAVRPYGVDVRSGVETNERKDIEKMRAFVRAVREADAEA
jgi:phosphoribosylanthranilate isomerase